MIDVHCHLNLKAFTDDFDAVIKDALRVGVRKIINVGTQISSSQRAIDLADQYENLYAIVGVHPHHADKPEPNWLEELEKLAKHKKVVAIGECGLDFYSYKSNGIVDSKIQQEVFIQQIILAHKHNLPLQIHNRQAGKDVIEILKAHQSLLRKDIPGMFHCFAGSTSVLKAALELGFYIGFDGNITYEGLAPGENTDLKDIARLTPLDRIVTETDSPFLTPHPYRGSRNIPSYVILVGEFLAKLKDVPFEAFVEQTTVNATRLFRFTTQL